MLVELSRQESVRATNESFFFLLYSMLQKIAGTFAASSRALFVFYGEPSATISGSGRPQRFDS